MEEGSPLTLGTLLAAKNSDPNTIGQDDRPTYLTCQPILLNDKKKYGEMLYIKLLVFLTQVINAERFVLLIDLDLGQIKV